MALPIVLLAIVILFILGFAISDTAIQHSILLNRENSSKKVYGQANAGLSQILYYLSTLNGWNGIAADATIVQYQNQHRAGTDPNFYYRLTNVTPGADQFTANIQVTGFAEQNGAVLLRRVLNASIHQQNPKSLGTTVFSERCLDGNGTPTITTDGSHPVVAFVNSSCNNGNNITVNPPGNYIKLNPDNQTQREEWYFPRLNESAVIQLAINNNLATWTAPEPAVCGGGHYYCSAFVGSGTWRLDQKVNNLAGTIYVEIPAGDDVKIASTDSDSTASPWSSGPPLNQTHDFNTNPNILIVKGGNLEMTGNVTYFGVILVPNGTVKINGSLDVTGAVFTKDGFISGGAGWSVTYDQSYVNALAPYVLKTIVIDSLWESN